MYKKSKSRRRETFPTLASSRTLTAKFEGYIHIFVGYESVGISKALPFDLGVCLSQTGESQDQAGNVSSESESVNGVIPAGKLRSEEYQFCNILYDKSEIMIEIYPYTYYRTQPNFFEYYPSKNPTYPLNFSYTYNGVKYNFQISN